MGNKELLPVLKRQIIVPSTAAVTRSGEGSAVLLKNGEILFTYYESENTVEDGKPERRNLASLKMLILKQENTVYQ